MLLLVRAAYWLAESSWRDRAICFVPTQRISFEILTSMCFFPHRQCVQVLRSQPHQRDLSSPSSFPDDIRDPLLLGPKPELKINTLDAKLEEADEILKQTIVAGGRGRKKKQAPNPGDGTSSHQAQNGSLPIYDEIVIEKE